MLWALFKEETEFDDGTSVMGSSPVDGPGWGPTVSKSGRYILGYLDFKAPDNGCQSNSRGGSTLAVEPVAH